MSSEQIYFVVIAGIIATTAVCVVPVIGYYLSMARQREQNAALKQMMIEKGFTADEICRVIEAGATQELAAKPSSC